MKLKLVCVENKGSNVEESDNSRKKVSLHLLNTNNWSNWSNFKQRKFQEQDGIIIDGLMESLGTKIGNDARLSDTANTRKEIYFKM